MAIVRSVVDNASERRRLSLANPATLEPLGDLRIAAGLAMGDREQLLPDAALEGAPDGAGVVSVMVLVMPRQFTGVNAFPAPAIRVK